MRKSNIHYQANKGVCKVGAQGTKHPYQDFLNGNFEEFRPKQQLWDLVRFTIIKEELMAKSDFYKLFKKVYRQVYIMVVRMMNLSYRHLMNIAIISAKTLKWKVFIRARL